MQKGLNQEGFTADYVLDGESGERRIVTSGNAYDVMVLDVMLPKKDGITVCKELRAQSITIPILMLTAKDTTTDKIVGLNCGADDYLTKPYSFDELVARLQALLRRPKSMTTQKLQVRDITLDTLSHEVTKQGKRVKLSQKEFAILKFLMMNLGRVVTRQEILDHVWDYDLNSFSNLVDVKIKNLRKKIDPKNTIIETVRGIGYKLTE